MKLSRISIKTIQIITIAIVLLFVVLSSFDCINIYKSSTGHSQMAIQGPEDIKEPSVYTKSCNNEVLLVAIVGGIEVVLIIVMCFKLSIVTAVIELLVSIGTLCVGYLESLFAEISGGVGAPLYTITFDITVIGYSVVLLAVVNLVLTVLLQIKRKTTMKGESENAINNNPNWT